jgi:acetolactate synthase I/II/III large subunit
MKVSDFIASELVRLGVTHVFTLCGGFSQHLNDSIAHTPGLIPIYMLHESGAAFAAVNYAAYTGGLGVCIVTSGPGSMNALNAVASAWDDSIPLLVISGEANVQNIENRRKFQLRQGGPQDVEIEQIVRPITKWCTTLRRANILHLLFFEDVISVTMDARRGPVWLAVPLDVQGMEMP